MANLNSLTVAATQAVLIVPKSDPKAIYAYVDGKRSNTQRVNDSGQPVFAFDALLQVNGQRHEGRITSTTSTLPELQFGGFLVGSGQTTITYRATADSVNNFTGRPFAYLTVSVEVEQVVVPQ